MRERIVAGNIYHVLNRGVDKRKIFMEDGDYFRFIHDLFEFNDIEPVLNLGRHFKSKNQLIDVGRQSIGTKRKPRKPLVEILAFCLMPNHYHLLLQPKSNEGVSEFMKKINGGYAKYFNVKHQRSGALFSGKYKSVPVKRDEYLLHLPFYIHLNPLDLATPEWRKKEIKNYKRAVAFLENYRWSSYLDYIGKKNFPSVTQREFLLEFFGGPAQYRAGTMKWLKEMDLSGIKELTLENQFD